MRPIVLLSLCLVSACSYFQETSEPAPTTGDLLLGTWRLDAIQCANESMDGAGLVYSFAENGNLELGGNAFSYEIIEQVDATMLQLIFAPSNVEIYQLLTLTEGEMLWFQEGSPNQEFCSFQLTRL